MDDVRKAAEERAARPGKAPIGASFESERQRSKNALVRQITSQDGRNVRMIAADCPDKVCVDTGWIGNGAVPIVCLPHHLVIRIEKQPQNDIDSVAR